VVVGKVAVHLCLTLIIKELKISVEQDRVVTNSRQPVILFMVDLSQMCLTRQLSGGF
jgi:hypothetical protein